MVFDQEMFHEPSGSSHGGQSGHGGGQENRRFGAMGNSRVKTAHNWSTLSINYLGV